MKRFRVWAVIPARGGSKGIPGKNLRPLGGRPLLVWTLEAALRTPGLERVVVSTDCPEIASLARSWGAEVPFLRPSHLATDQASLASAVDYTVDRLAESHEPPHAVLTLYPTSPLRPPGLLERALEGLRSHARFSSCVPVDLVPARWRVELEGGSLPVADRTDSVLLAYPTGAFVGLAYAPPALRGVAAAARRIRYLAERFGSGYTPHGAQLMLRDPLSAVDIDEPGDLVRAEALLTGRSAEWPSHASRLPFCVVPGKRLHALAGLLGGCVELGVQLEPGIRTILFVGGCSRDGRVREREFHELEVGEDGGLRSRPFLRATSRVRGRATTRGLELEIEPPAGTEKVLVALALEPEDALCDFVQPFSLRPFWTFDPDTGLRRNLLTGRPINGRQDMPRLVEAHPAVGEAVPEVPVCAAPLLAGESP